MRMTRSLVGGVLFLALAASGCDTRQPLQLSSQEIEVFFTAVNAVGDNYNVWDMIEDSDFDGLPDDGVTYLWCELLTGPADSSRPVSVPWNHSIEISVIRSGTFERERLTSNQGLQLDSSVSAYDTTPQLFNLTPDKADYTALRCAGGLNNAQPCVDDFSCPIGGGGFATCASRRFVFSNPRRETALTRAVISATSNLLFDLNPPLTAPLAPPGVCSTFDPGPESVDSSPAPFTVTLGKGDTILVNARISPTTPMGVNLSTVPSLSGQMLVDGLPVVPRGNETSSITSGTGISFSYTSQ